MEKRLISFLRQRQETDKEFSNSFLNFEVYQRATSKIFFLVSINGWPIVKRRLCKVLVVRLTWLILSDW